ncbi:MAG: DUF2219 domain-containing protein [Micavibrio aeruginosavorus]|uniref:DUF2219 domain-containing protein n=1 Tax=Micavibrio aeruginosavorus TaxID=349221 RepID=A0A2W5HS81_9BACT|nr:MAG: DUF2219 domain-containing protein [Micavibrio aeruginosavorus]
MKKLIPTVSLLTLIMLPVAVKAQEAPPLMDQVPAEIKRQNITDSKIITLNYENDMIGGGEDQYYTNGVRASLLDLNAGVPDALYKVADFIPLVDLNDETGITYSVGQNLYTPSDIKIAGRQEGDRPWAAFLYGSAGLTTISDDHIDEVEMTLGMVGPAALGEQTQKFIHEHVSDSPTPKGWSHQLKNEPGLILSAQRRWPKLWETDVDGLSISAGPYAGATLGNVYTYGNGGFTVQISPKGSEWQGMPVRVRPAMPGSGFFSLPEDGLDWSIFAGVEGRAVGRNIFLDGNTFTDSQSVDKKFIVGDANAGIATTIGRVRLSYSIVWRSKEFDGQEDDTIFGVANLGIRY